MRCHQVLTGACNAGDRCFAVGSVEGVPFTAYAAGCNVVILSNTFERVQVIPGACHDNVQILCIDCSTDTGKIASAYGKLVCIFEPTPLSTQNSSHRLDYRWIQTGYIEAGGYINTLSWNMEGTRLLTAGDTLQMWVPPHNQNASSDDSGSHPVTFDVGEVEPEEEWSWQCLWQCVTSSPTTFLSFSPDGTLFATCSANDRLVKVWYDNKLILSPSKVQEISNASGNDSYYSNISYGYIYLPHPSSVTGFTWRATSKYMPKGSVSNMLLTSCRDNICRVWAETVLPDDGLVSLHHLDPVASQNPRFRMHRHKHRFMQRLKHIKTCFHIRRHTKNGTIPPQYSGVGHRSGGFDPLPTIPSSYSVHDFHMYGFHASGVTPGFHFNLAATVNAETDIPLVPSISNVGRETEQNFVIHWLNNKDMFFTSEAENILLEVSKRALDKEFGYDQDQLGLGDFDDTRMKSGAAVPGLQKGSSRPPSHMGMRGRSIDEEEIQSQHSTSIKSHQPLSAATSSTSIATDVTMATASPLGDALDRRIETLLRDWYQTSDMLFSVHPVDGSLLVWILDFLDGQQGVFRQAQVSFCARIPNALPLGDAMTMSPNLAIYNGTTPYFLKSLIKLESMSQEEEKNKAKSKSTLTLTSTEEFDFGYGTSSPPPVICLTTKHSNGSLNLWHLTVAEDSRFTQVLNISHSTRVCGHRFQLNDLKCHPVLPLLLTTSHHNKQVTSPVNPPSCAAAADDTPLICINDTSFKDWCSELILWRVDAVGPLNRSGGVTELSRINSPQLSAFSNVAWIPTLLPSTTLGSVSNSPSACFVASDGDCLRIYQAVIDGRALLAEISTAEHKKRMMESTLSLSSDSSLQERVGKADLADIFNVVSEQSTARPGCIIQLDTIIDATHDWQNTQFLHVYQEGLICGEKSYSKSQDADGSPVINLHPNSGLEEPFYITLLEKTKEGFTMHMWRLVISSAIAEEEADLQGESHEAKGDAANHNAEASPVNIASSKIYRKRLPLPYGVEVIHSCPAAGHLSSASIYPACYAPYVLVTACSDNKIRFWRCRMSGEHPDVDIEWQEWSMICKDRNSTIKVPGRPLQVNAAYSGRIVVAYMKPGQRTCVNASDGSLSFSCTVSVYECESTGGSEWVLADTLQLQDVVMNSSGLAGQDFDLGFLSQLAVDRSSSKLTFALSNEDLTQPSATCNSDHASAEAIHSVSSQMHVPSLSTLQSLRSNRFGKPDVNLKQKYPVQLDWLSMEDGSHLLTVAIGSKVMVYICCSEEVLQIGGGGVVTTNTEKRQRPHLQKSLSLTQMTPEVMPRWMRLEKLSLKTADGLTPLPMRISWVRDGILVVGMDNEMHIYSQWPLKSDENQPPDVPQPLTSPVQGRELSQAHLRTMMKDTTTHPKMVTSMSRITSYSVLSALDNKMKKGLGDVIETTFEDIDDIQSTGLFEANHLVSPVLPQYHPRQLMELLNSGRIKRVKAILAHLLRCLMVLGRRETDAVNRNSLSDVEDTKGKSWSKSRTLSTNTGPGSGSGREGRNSISLRPEELTLDYIEVKAIPPLPLWLLLQADKERPRHKTNAPLEGKQDTYAELFGGPSISSDVDDDLNLDDEDADAGAVGRRKSLTLESRGIAHFGPRETQGLAALLTHTHLPGLSSLDQMHLLALADTVASCNVDFAERSDINKAKEAMAKETYSRAASDEPSMESLDDCGLRFLLAMRHHIYLLRCLPIGQRAQLQKAGIGSHNLVWAFHSESQEELLNFIPAVRQGNVRWPELRELGIGWWVRSNSVLANVMLKVAKAAFQLRNDPLDAAIYYLAMKKKNLVWGLFRSISDKKMTEFFAKNFTEERWRKAALKNAFALMGRQRFEHAAAFFLLAGALKDAIEVVVNKLQDEALSFVITRLYEGELDATPPSLQRLLYTRFLGCDENHENEDLSKVHPDPFIRSLSYWMLKDYNNSLNTLLLTDSIVGCAHPEYSINKNDKNSELTTAEPSVFNFYIYLRTHPLLIRQCVANSAKEATGAFMASRLGSGHDALDKKSIYESSITPEERRLYFKTASAHLCSGCPALALEVLSKLPNNVIDLDNPSSGDLLGSPVKRKKRGLELIKSGTLDDESSFEMPVQAHTAADLFNSDANKDPFSWSTPSNFNKGFEDDLQLDFSIEAEEEDDEFKEEITRKNKMNREISKTEDDRLSSQRKHLDIMAQQLKFISCLKMMMEELATLATGCEVDGGQLRYQLYVWLEREVEALQEICNYRCNPTHTEDLSKCMEDSDRLGSPSPAPVLEQPASLHEVLQQEKREFEEKMERAKRRKHWLVANQQLLRTLLSYCSLHGSSGGGLASVRMELILLLQELQQENNRQQLLSPLPFPTTLPLLSASIACNKTVVADPVKHLQSGTHDLLYSLVPIASLAVPDNDLLIAAFIFRNLAAALSACIYQALCDSETLTIKTQPRVAALGLDLHHVSVAHKESHLVTRDLKTSGEDEQLKVCTAPSKWPGVTSLVALMGREKDEDTPKLNILLCEAFVAVYLSLLIHGIASSDAYVLYRLVSIKFIEKDWGTLFGGGVKKALKVVSSTLQTSTEKEQPSQTPGEGLLSTISNLQKTRIKINMKLLGQLGFQDPRTTTSTDDAKPTYREYFSPPEMSIVSYLMKKPVLPSDQDNVDYDSAGSDDEDEDIDDEEDEDVFKEPKVFPENTEHSNTDSYSWCLLRLACVRRAQSVVGQFLRAAEVELQELAIQSPLLHSILRSLDIWVGSLICYIEEKKGPPPEYIPGCFAESSVIGPAILKYKAILETHNTPFARNKKGAKPVVRLWMALVHQEQVQDVFIRYIFGRKRPAPEPMLPDPVPEDITSESAECDGEIGSEEGLENQREHSEQGGPQSDAALPSLDPVRIIHKDQDPITSFSISKVNPNLICVATVKEVQELDITLLLKHPSWLTNECELDVIDLNRDLDSLASPNFFVVQTPLDKPMLEARGMDASYSTLNLSGSPVAGSSQTGRGTSVIQTYKLEGTRRMSAHPVLPLYLVGCQDGSVVVREWHHSQPVANPRPGGTFAKVTRVRYNQQGNKFGVIDGDGHLSLYHAGITSQNNKSFYTQHCHNKHGNDFTFVGSSSLIATAGQASEHRNVALWDTLMPQRKANVVAWSCHDSGASSIIYAPQHQVLISAGKKGQVCIFDVRQRLLRHKFTGHEAAIKSMALDINEDFFVTGSADGDIKVWGLSVHNLVYNLSGEHSRTSLFKNLSQGVTHLHLDSSNRLFSSGADGSLRLRNLPERDMNVNLL